MVGMVIARLPLYCGWKAGPSIIRKSSVYGVRKAFNFPSVIKSAGGCTIRTALLSVCAHYTRIIYGAWTLFTTS